MDRPDLETCKPENSPDERIETLKTLRRVRAIIVSYLSVNVSTRYETVRQRVYTS